MLFLQNLLTSSKINEMFKEVVDKVMRGLNSVSDYFPILLYQLIAVTIIVIFIKVFFWGKITKYLEKERYEMIKNKLDTEKERNEALALKEAQKKAYSEFKQENRKIREQVKSQAILDAEKIREEAKLQAKERLERVEQEITQEVKTSEDKIREIIVEISYKAAEKILKKELDHSKYDALIADVTNDMLEKKINERE